MYSSACWMRANDAFKFSKELSHFILKFVSSSAIAISGVEDVRDVLDFYRNEEDVVAAFRRNQEVLRKQQEEQVISMQKKSPGRWSIFGKV